MVVSPGRNSIGIETLQIGISDQATRIGTLTSIFRFSRSGLERFTGRDGPVQNLYRGSRPAKYMASYGVRTDRVRAIRDDGDEARTASATEIGPSADGRIWFQTAPIGDSEPGENL
jgi:hypothetical protein